MKHVFFLVLVLLTSQIHAASSQASVTIFNAPLDSFSQMTSGPLNEDDEEEDDEEEEMEEELVSLTLGTIDSNQYGRNYGRDGNESVLDVSFTPIVGRDHELSWRAFDIELDEMEVFLNGTQIRTVPTTPPNSLGEVQVFIIPAANVVSGVNTLSFRVTDGNETWGVTRLRARALAEIVDGEPATSILLDEPERGGSAFGGSSSTNFTFEFSPRGRNYGETVKISFNSFVKSGGTNGFEVLLNGGRILSVGSYLGSATFINRSVTIDKSRVRSGSNTLTLNIITPPAGTSIDAGFDEVRVETSSVPLLDVAVGALTVAEEISINTPFDASVIVNNLGAKASPANTLTFFVSENANRTGRIEVASTTMASLAAEASRSVRARIESSEIKNDRYLWACIGRLTEDILAANDCSPNVQLDVQGSAVVTPMIMILLDE